MKTQTRTLRGRLLGSGRFPALAGVLGCLAAFAPLAQNFDNGSTGALGDVVIEANTTLDLPPDGILHYKSLRVNTGVTLDFNRNALNTPVYVLAQEAVTIEGTINVSGSVSPNNVPDSGRGGPGGFDGGKPGFNEVPPGDGYGPGGGKGGVTDSNLDAGAGSGSYSTVSPAWTNPNKGAIYGSRLLIPLVGGSGGGGSTGAPGRGGGGGGGAILISSNVRVDLSGRILAQGGNANGAGGNTGSGGAVRLVAPVVAGTGEINVLTPNNYGGFGRIRVETLDRRGLQLNFQPQATTSVGANLFIFPPDEPRLDLIEVAGNAIPVGNGPVTLQLPFGSTPDRIVKVRAENWNSLVQIRVVLTPDSGPRVTVDAEVDNTTQNPATVDVPVTLPVNELVTIHAWTR